MSYKTEVTFSDGNVYVQMPEEAAEHMVAEVLTGFRDLLLESMDGDAKRYMIDGHLHDHRVRNVRDNLMYLSSINTVLEYLGADDAE
tara:strand:- start:3782 stop:4042 length:261 start_codon:yes stop_codon:yes gene_type:complete